MLTKPVVLAFSLFCGLMGLALIFDVPPDPGTNLIIMVITVAVAAAAKFTVFRRSP